MSKKIKLIENKYYKIDSNGNPISEIKDKREIIRLIEDLRINWICEQINTKTDIGKQMCQDYHNLFEKIISYVEKKNSNKSHYDLVIHHEDNTKKKCEEKGSDTYKELVVLDLPWDNSVQRFNGLGNKFTVGIKYAKMWYDIIIKDHKVCKIYGIDTSLIPSEQQWLEKDAFQCGDPKTEYSKQLKETHQKLYGGSMNGKNKSSIDYRERVNEKFISEFNQEDKQILMKETQDILDSIMDEKECWLQTTGKINEKFNWKWYKKIGSPKIKDITLTWNKGSDIYFNFIVDDSKYNFKCILRFGKGTGFSNIRFDIR